jgi:hypothetical protein
MRLIEVTHRNKIEVQLNGRIELFLYNEIDVPMRNQIGESLPIEWVEDHVEIPVAIQVHDLMIV